VEQQNASHSLRRSNGLDRVIPGSVESHCDSPRSTVCADNLDTGPDIVGDWLWHGVATDRAEGNDELCLD